VEDLLGAGRDGVDVITQELAIDSEKAASTRIASRSGIDSAPGVRHSVALAPTGIETSTPCTGLGLEVGNWKGAMSPI
jgi:hypothetical protein